MSGFLLERAANIFKHCSVYQWLYRVLVCTLRGTNERICVWNVKFHHNCAFVFPFLLLFSNLLYTLALSGGKNWSKLEAALKFNNLERDTMKKKERCNTNQTFYSPCYIFISKSLPSAHTHILSFYLYIISFTRLSMQIIAFSALIAIYTQLKWWWQDVVFPIYLL